MGAAQTSSSVGGQIKTPDQRLRVFISSTLNELAPEREAAKAAVGELKLIPVMFEAGARPHPPRPLYRSYIEQSHVFIAVYWESYGWVAPDMDISGIEDEYMQAAGKPKLIYVKKSSERDERLAALLEHIRTDDDVSYKPFDDADQLRGFIADDLALLLTERFEREQSTARPAEITLEEKVRSNLPAMVNLFVGRAKEISVLHRLVMHDGARIVTLTGPGGIGKSRLSLEFANAVKDHFPDGVFLIMLQTVRDEGLVDWAVAKTLGVQEVAGEDKTQTIIEDIRDKKMLLLFDNFEHVLGAAGIVSRLVAECPNLTAVVTSRSPLNLQGEHEIPIPPLGIPSEMPGLKLDAMDRCEAVQLFIDRAKDAKPDLTLTDDDAAEIAEIARKLDGIPLALELAAARVRMLSPAAMLSRLTDRFGLLRGGWRDLPDRHKTLRSTIDWSFDLLDDSEKTFFMRIGVFNGGWTLETAAPVCDPEGELDVLELMASLVDKSLIYSYPSHDEPRFSMLETIREYALDKLSDAGEEQEVRGRHADFFLTLVAAAHPRMRSHEQDRALEQLEDEAGNIRLALGWLIDNGRSGEAAEASWQLWLFWWLSDRFEEGTTITAQILESKDLTEWEHAIALAAAGCMSFWRGDYGACMAQLNGAMDAFREFNYKEGIALCQLALGIIAAALMGPAESIPRFEEARSIFDETNEKWGGALARNAEHWLQLGLETEIPEKELIESVEIAVEAGTEVEIAGAHGNYGAALIARGRLAEAREHLLISLQLLSKTRVRNLATYTLDQVAELCLADGSANAAARLFGAAQALRLRAGAPLAQAHVGRWTKLVESGKRSIGEEAFDAAFDAGSQLDFQSAMREAMARCAKSVPTVIGD